MDILLNVVVAASGLVALLALVIALVMKIRIGIFGYVLTVVVVGLSIYYIFIRPLVEGGA